MRANKSIPRDSTLSLIDESGELVFMLEVVIYEADAAEGFLGGKMFFG